MNATEQSTALDGIRVLDLTRVLAGPWATQTLADLGACVTKVERPGTGDTSRLIGPYVEADDAPVKRNSAFYLGCNRGKESITVDIADPRGAELIRQLAQQSDVFIENYKTGDLKRYGLDYDSIKQLNPSIVYCSITGFGQDGPYAARPAYDSVLQAVGGLMSTCGFSDRPPTRTSVPIADILTGLYATIAVLAALMQRRQTGMGQYIDCAMIDVTVAANAHLALGYLMTGQVPQRQGNDNPIASPSEIIETSDGAYMLSVGTDSQFADLARELGLPELASDPRFTTNIQRVRNRAALIAIINGVTRRESSAYWQARFLAANVPGGPINDMRQVFDDAHVAHRALAMRVPHALGGEVPMLRSPLRLSASAVEHRAAPLLGEHTQAVLRERLSLDDEAIAALAQAGVVSLAQAGVVSPAQPGAV